MVSFKGEWSPCCHALVHWEIGDYGDGPVYENPWCDDCAGDVQPSALEVKENP